MFPEWLVQMRGWALFIIVPVGLLVLALLFGLFYVSVSVLLRSIEKWDIRRDARVRTEYRRLCEQDDADIEARERENNARHVEEEEWPRLTKTR